MVMFYDGFDGHFDADIEIYPLEKSGRKHHPLNGIRWAFAYADDFAEDVNSGVPVRVSDVWPEFIDEQGKSIPGNVPLVGRLKARMHIMFPKMVPVHMKRLKIGTKFFCVDGGRANAEGVVTAIKRSD